MRLKLFKSLRGVIGAVLTLSVLPLTPVLADGQSAQTGVQAPPSESSSVAAQTLINMVGALESRSYSGTLTYEFGGPLETLQFSRLVKPQGTLEQIRHLSGKPRNFTRQLPAEYCGNAARRLFIAQGKAPLAGLSEYYSFHMLGRNRVADRAVNIVQIKPKLGDRYGFTVGVDVETGLPLMLTLTGNRGQVLERFQFVELTPAPVVEVLPQGDPAQHLALTEAHCEQAQLPSGWRPRWLPAGYVLASALADPNRTRLSFTDGLSSISIFITPIQSASGAVGVVQRGATVAAMTLTARDQASFKVAVVGEIPPPVARKIAASMAYEP